MLAPRWCPRGITKTQKMQFAKDASKRVGQEKKEEEWEYWFNNVRAMTKPKEM
jgi:hypothetical protein